MKKIQKEIILTIRAFRKFEFEPKKTRVERDVVKFLNVLYGTLGTLAFLSLVALVRG